ncbi:MAG: tetratricopeptide repeat protein [Saprospiraceae bacterium]|nr:tetratricopeptide repeat protein [Saprospiraceae bacterium]
MRRSPFITLVLLVTATLLFGQGDSFQEKAGFALEPQHYVEQADGFFEAEDWEPAAEYYAAALEDNPQDAKALYNYALANFKLENFGKTTLTLEKLFALSPTDTAAYELYGHALLQRGQVERGIEYLSMVLLAMPSEDRFVHRALANISIRHTADALRDFDAALGMNPNNFDACLGKGITLLEMGQPKLAAAWLEKALEVKPEDAVALNNLAIIEYQMGEKEAAMSHFRTALQSARLGEIFLARAKCYLLDHNYSDAIADAREAMLLDGENPEVYAFIGNVETEKGDLEGAIESYGIAIDIKPDHAGYYMGRASACIRNKQYEDAVSDLYRALDLEPYSTEARKLLQTAYSHIDADMLSGNEEMLEDRR